MTKLRTKNNKLPQSKIMTTEELTVFAKTVSNAFLKLTNQFGVLQKQLDESQKQLDDLAIMMEAFRRIINPSNDTLPNLIKEIRIELLEKNAKIAEEEVQKALNEGKLIANEIVDDATLVGISAVKADGSPKYPSLSFIPFANLKPEIQAIMKGKKVNDVVTDPSNGDLITVKSIYAEVLNAEATN
jgi:hypothetical protein